MQAANRRTDAQQQVEFENAREEPLCQSLREESGWPDTTRRAFWHSRSMPRPGISFLILLLFYFHRTNNRLEDWRGKWANWVTIAALIFRGVKSGKKEILRWSAGGQDSSCQRWSHERQHLFYCLFKKPSFVLIKSVKLSNINDLNPVEVGEWIFHKSSCCDFKVISCVSCWF